MSQLARHGEHGRPPVRDRAVPEERRARLHEVLTEVLLGENERRTVVALTAAAGAGKTRLLSAWCAEQLALGSAAVVWLACDELARDDPLVVRDAVLAAAPAKLHGAVDSSARHDDVSPRGLCDAFRRYGARVVIVLDDAHALGGQVERWLAALMELSPPNVRFAVAARGTAPLRIARLRASGRVADLRADELSFTRTEAAAVAGHTLREDELDRVMATTEGWPAMVGLLGTVSVSDLLDAPAGAELEDSVPHPLEEAFGAIPVQDREFLLRTAVPDDFTLELAGFLTGRDPMPVLGRLETSTALLDRKQNDARVFRYHPLFRRFLLSSARGRDEGARRRDEGACVEWFERHGDRGRALSHSQRAGDHAHLARLVEVHGMGLILGDHAALVSNAAKELALVATTSPEIMALRAAADLHLGHAAPARAALRAPRATGLDQVDPDLVGGLRLAAALHDHGAGTLRAALSASPKEPQSDRPDHAVYLGLHRAAAELRIGRLAEAEFLTEGVRHWAADAALGLVELQCLELLCMLAAYRGRALEIPRRVADAETRAADLGLRRSRTMDAVRVWGGWAAYRRGRLDDASVPFRDPSSLTERVSTNDSSAWRTGVLLRAASSGGDPHVLPILRGTTRGLISPLHQHIMGLAVGQRLLLDAGDIAGARHFLETSGAELGDSLDVKVLRGVQRLAEGDPEGARAAVAQLVMEGARTTWSPLRITAWLVEAAVHRRADNIAAAQPALTAAIEIARGAGEVRPFLDFAADVHPLLTQGYARTGEIGAFADHLLHATSGAQAVVILTERQREVLARLAKPGTVGELATALGVSRNTVKTHVKALYGKLGVATRREAVNRARGLGLL